MTAKYRSTDVTVVIPTRDRAEVLEQTVRSVITSTCMPGRVVVIDNSQKNPDPTRVLCDSLAVEYLPPVGDLGFHENHNRALAQSRTALTCLVQDDDVWSPNFVERALGVMNGSGSPVLFASNYRVIDENGSETASRAWPRFPNRVLSSAEYALHCMENMPPVHLSAAMFLTGAVPDGGLAPVDGMCTDMGFFLRLAMRGPVALVDEPLSAIRIHSDMASVEAGFVGSRDRSRSPVSTFDPLEWRVKRRFLDEDGARKVLGACWGQARRSAARRASGRLFNEAFRGSKHVSLRLDCLRSIVKIAPFAVGLPLRR